jgi:hypothetical protein
MGKIQEKRRNAYTCPHTGTRAPSKRWEVAAPDLSSVQEALPGALRLGGSGTVHYQCSKVAMAVPGVRWAPLRLRGRPVDSVPRNS